MGRLGPRALVGALVVACVCVIGSVAHGSGKSALALGLSSDDAGPGGLPETFRVVITNRSGHEVAGANLCLTFYAGDEFYAWAWVSPPGDFTLGPSKRLVQVLPLASLAFDGPNGQRRAATAVASRLSHSRWSVVASVIDDSVGGPTGTAVTVSSNELAFGPVAARHAKP